MNTAGFKTIFTAVIFFATVLSSCTYTTTRIKEPIFSTEVATIEKGLDSLVKNQGVNVTGKEVTSNKTVSSELEISVNNGKHVPSDNDQTKALGKSIARLIMRNLKDPNEYDTYRVLFVTKIMDGSITKSTWKGNFFSVKELQ